MSTMSIERQKQPFFGGDGRSRLFTKYFVAGNLSKFDAFPSTLAADSMAFDVMKAENHKKNQGMEPNDVHNDFTDFIIQTALFHRQIDAPTEAGELKSKLKAKIVDRMNQYTIDTINSVNPSGHSIFPLASAGNGNKFSFNEWISFALSNNVIAKYASETGIPSPSAAKVIADLESNPGHSDAIFDSAVGIRGTKNITEINTGDLTVANHRDELKLLVLLMAQTHIIGFPKTDYNNNTHYVYNLGTTLVKDFDTLMTYFVSDCDAANSDRSNLLCWITEQQTAPKPGAFSGLIRELKTKLKAETQAEFESKLYDEVKKRAKESIANGIKTGIKMAIDKFGENSDAANSVARINYYNNSTKRGDVFNELDVWYGRFVTQLSLDISDAAMSVISNYFGAQYTTAGGTNDAAKKLIKDVYGKWSSLPSDVQDFYQSQMRLSNRASSGVWEYPSSDKYEAFAATADTQAQNLRVNLRKVSPGDSRPAFFEMIPRLPLEKTGDIWYTAKDNSLGRSSKAMWQGMAATFQVDGANYSKATDAAKDVQSSVLRLLYYKIYKHGGDKVEAPVSGFDPIPGFANLLASWDDVVKAGRVLDLYPGFKIDELLRKKLFQLKSEAEVDTAGEQFVDLVTKTTWFRETDGKLYTKRGDKKLFMDSANPDDVNQLIKENYQCYSSLFNSGSAKCEQLIRNCIMESDPAKLKTCIDLLQSVNKGDYIENIKDEIGNMNPYMAIGILQKLGFRKVKVMDPETGRPCVRVQDVNAWLRDSFKGKLDRNNIANSENIQKEVAKNEPLLVYLKYVVAFINSNPSILNKDSSAVSQSADLSNYAKALSLTRRSVDRQGSAITMATGLDYIEASIRNSLLGASRSSRYVQRWPYGVSFGGKLVQSGGNMLAGSGYMGNGAFVVDRVFSHLLSKLKGQGKQLVDSDAAKIKAKIDTLRQLESQLVKSVRYVELFTDLLDVGVEYGSNTINEKTLQDFVNSHAQLVEKQGKNELVLLQILKAMERVSRGVPTSEATEVKQEDAGQVDVGELNRK